MSPNSHLNDPQLWSHRTPSSSRERPELPGRKSPVRLMALRAYALIALIVIAMAVALLVAKHVLLTDWSDKTRHAKAAAAERAAKAAAAESLTKHAEADAPTDSPEALRREAEASWLYVLGKGDARRAMRGLAAWEKAAGLPKGAAWRALAAGVDKQERSKLAPAALRMAGVSPRTLNAWALFDMGRGSYASAIRRLDALLKLYPGMPAGLYNLALCQVYARQPAQAIGTLAAYLGQRPDDEAGIRLQATLLVQMGKPEAALDLLEAFVARARKPSAILLDAAFLEARQGYDSTAIRHLEAAIPAVPLGRIIQVYNTPDFQRARLTEAGRALTARLADFARAAAASPMVEAFPLPTRPLQGAKRQ